MDGLLVVKLSEVIRQVNNTTSTQRHFCFGHVKRTLFSVLDSDLYLQSCSRSRFFSFAETRPRVRLDLLKGTYRLTSAELPESFMVG